MRVGVLGPLEVRDSGGEVRAVGGARLRRLLIRLAISGGQSVSVDRLAADLWPEEQPGDAANAVQALVSRLRAVTARDFVAHGPGGYRLAVGPDEVDADAFEQLVRTGRGIIAGGDPAGGAAVLAQALALWRGPALSEVADAEFATATITRLDELRLAALEDRIEADLGLGRGAELVPELQELAAAHPLRERLRSQLMRALQAAGRQAEALAAFEDTRRTLAEQLGVDPSPALAEVHLAILRGDAGERRAAGPAAAPPPAEPRETRQNGARPHGTGSHGAGAYGAGAYGAGAGAYGTGDGNSGHEEDESRSARGWARSGNLPAQLTTFVGREDELRRLGRLLGEARLVTLTGPGGAGKTRLSIEASARLSEELPDGVWFVPLAPVRDALDVPQAVLSAMGLLEVRGPADAAEAALLAATPPLDRLADALAARKMLLVLDNCEHLVDAVAWMAGRVLARAPGVRILATSREPLGITGESLCPVPSLPLPPEGADATTTALSPAVRLLLDRAGAVRPGFGLNAETTGPVVRICRALDGIPLAIELAAARLRALTPAQVADRLDDRFRLLSVGSRTALPQHQTLRAIVDWSWELLGETERTVLRRLAVFSGGATPDSAEQVCALGGDPAAMASDDIIDVVAALVDKSLVTVTGAGEVRYRLLETVRAYATDRLAEAGETVRTRAAHAEYFAALAQQAEPHIRGREQVLWLERLAAEHDNCAAALRYAISVGEVRLALRMVGALAQFWMMRDYDAEAGEWATAVRDLAGDTPPEDLRDAYALCQFLSMASQVQRERVTATGILEVGRRMVELSRGTSHPLLVLAAPMVAAFSGQPEEASRLLEVLAAHPDPWARAAGLMMVGFLASHNGDIARAGEIADQAYQQFREIGDRWGMAVCLGALAEVALARDRPAEAVRALEQARELATEGLAGNWGEMMSIPLGRARARAGDTAGGRAELKRGIALAEHQGEHDDEARAWVELSELARRDGDLAEAGRLLAEAVRIVEPREHSPGVLGVAASAYSRTGALAEQQGDLAAAARWHARALGLLSGGDAELMPSNPELAAVVEGVAALAAARGDAERAAELLGLARTLQGFTNAASLEAARAQAVIAAGLDEAQAETAYARGRQLSRRDALALVP